MSNKYVKLTSKRRQRPKTTYVTFEGVQMTAVEREALLRKRAAENKQAKAMKPTPKTPSKGQIIEQPTQRPTNSSPKKKPGGFKRLSWKLFGKKKKSTKPTLEATPQQPSPEAIIEEAVIAETTADDAGRIEEIAAVKVDIVETTDSAQTIEMTEEQINEDETAAIHEAIAVEEAVEENIDEPPATEDEEEPEEVVEEQTPEGKATAEQVVQLYQKLKRVPKLELLRFARQTATGTDTAIKEHLELSQQLEAKEAEIKAAKTPKDATEDQRKALNKQRAALRKERDVLKRKLLIAYEKAVSLERASDEYAAVASWLLKKEVNYRKQPRLNPVDPNLSENIIPLSEQVANSSVPGVPKERIKELGEELS